MLEHLTALVFLFYKNQHYLSRKAGLAYLHISTLLIRVIRVIVFSVIFSNLSR